MRVAVVLRSVNRNTGGRASALDLAESLQALGHDVYILISGEGGYRKIFKKNNALQNTTVSMWNVLPLNKRALSYHYKEWKLFSSIIYFFLSFIFFRLGGVRRTLKKIDVIFDAAMLSDEEITSIKHVGEAKIIYNHAGDPDIYVESWLHGLDSNISHCSCLAKYQYFCSRYDGLLFQAKSQKEKNDKYLRINIRKYVLNPSCAEQDLLISRRSPSPYSGSKFVIVCVGSVQERKGQELSIKSLHMMLSNIPHRNVELHFVGKVSQDSYYKNLVEGVSRLGLEDVVFFHGHKNDYARYICNADVVLQTSFSEGVSRVLREAMFLKVPIVTFNISGTSDLLSDSDAMLAEPYDVHQVARHLESVISDLELRDSIIQNAFESYMVSSSRSAYSLQLEDFLKVVAEL